MSLRAYKIKEISATSTFDLTFDGPFWSILDQIGVLKDIGEGGGIISLDREDLKEMVKLLDDYDEAEVESARQIISEIKKELDPKWGYVIYYCH